VFAMLARSERLTLPLCRDLRGEHTWFGNDRSGNCREPGHRGGEGGDEFVPRLLCHHSVILSLEGIVCVVCAEEPILLCSVDRSNRGVVCVLCGRRVSPARALLLVPWLLDQADMRRA